MFVCMYTYVCVCRSAKSPIASKRISNIIEYLTFESFKYTARGLYESDKFLLTLLLTLKIDMQGNKVNHQEFSCLIKGTVSKEQISSYHFDKNAILLFEMIHL